MFLTLFCVISQNLNFGCLLKYAWLTTSKHKVPMRKRCDYISNIFSLSAFPKILECFLKGQGLWLRISRQKNMQTLYFLNQQLYTTHTGPS